MHVGMFVDDMRVHSLLLLSVNRMSMLRQPDLRMCACRAGNVDSDGGIRYAQI